MKNVNNAHKPPSHSGKFSHISTSILGEYRLQYVAGYDGKATFVDGKTPAPH